MHEVIQKFQELQMLPTMLLFYWQSLQFLTLFSYSVSGKTYNL